jgi:hypothetical protein
MAKSRAQQAAIAISMKKAGKKPKSLPKAQKGVTVKKAVKDSTDIYWDQFKRAKQQETYQGVLGGPKDEIAAKWRKKADVAASNYKRQFNKNKPGYDANGFPVKKTTTKKKG